MVVLIVANRNGDDGSATAAVGPFRAAALTVGLQDDQITSVIDDSVTARADRLAASGVTFTRLDVSWVTIAPTAPAAPTDPNDPAYLWERFDTVVDALAARKLEPIVAFSGSPSWANGGGGPEAAPDVEAYGAFVHAFATRYSGAGRPRIRVFEPWDAPNTPARLMPQWDPAGAKPASPAIYAALLNRAYAEIKAVDPDAIVAGSSAGHVEASLPPTGGVGVLDWLAALTALAPKMDAVAQHIEPTSAPSAPSEAVPSFSTLPRLMQELGRLAPKAPVLITKLDYATPPGGLTEADQAAYLTQALQRLAGESSIRLVVWGSLRDGPARFTGLLHEDGTEKAAWAVFAAGQKALPSAATP
jgi:polysaccharide biosynthesis protein PslG